MSLFGTIGIIFESTNCFVEVRNGIQETMKYQHEFWSDSPWLAKTNLASDIQSIPYEVSDTVRVVISCSDKNERYSFALGRNKLLEILDSIDDTKDISSIKNKVLSRLEN